MSKVTVTAKTIDEAISLALSQLNATRDQVTVTVLEEPSKGFLGLIGVRQAKLEVELQEVQEDQDDIQEMEEAEEVQEIKEEQEASQEAADPIGEAKKFLEQVLSTMDITAYIEVKKQKDAVLFDIVGKDLGIIIGRRGQTLDSLQFLVNTVGNKYSDSYLRIILDAEDYREKRKQTLEQLADRLAQKALKTGQLIKLEPMPAHERKVIHTYLQGRKTVQTHSEGDEPQRYLVIQPKAGRK